MVTTQPSVIASEAKQSPKYYGDCFVAKPLLAMTVSSYELKQKSQGYPRPSRVRESTWEVYFASPTKSYSIACVMCTRANSPGASSRETMTTPSTSGAGDGVSIAPAGCVAIEDSETGIASAKAAGLRAIAVPNRYTAHQDLSRADARVESLAEALRLI